MLPYITIYKEFEMLFGRYSCCHYIFWLQILMFIKLININFNAKDPQGKILLVLLAIFLSYREISDAW